MDLLEQTWFRTKRWRQDWSILQVRRSWENLQDCSSWRRFSKLIPLPVKCSAGWNPEWMLCLSLKLNQLNGWDSRELKVHSEAGNKNHVVGRSCVCLVGCSPKCFRMLQVLSSVLCWSSELVFLLCTWLNWRLIHSFSQLDKCGGKFRGLEQIGKTDFLGISSWEKFPSAWTSGPCLEINL